VVSVLVALSYLFAVFTIVVTHFLSSLKLKLYIFRRLRAFKARHKLKFLMQSFSLMGVNLLYLDTLKGGVCRLGFYVDDLLEEH
jgi:hypothetical protein